MLRQNYRQADCLIAVSNYVKKKSIEHGADPARIIVIPNGVDTNVFLPRPTPEARAQLGLSPNEFLILFTGNLVPRKGVDVLLHAFSRFVDDCPNARLLLLGTGDEQEKLATMARELGVAESVMFAGFKPLTEISAWYQACDAFVMPSWAEGLSLSVLEAMASGKPVVTTRPDVGEHDAVISGKTGVLTTYGDVDELARVLLRLASNSALAQEMGAAARKRAVENFDWQQIARQTVDVYRTVLQHSTQANG